MKVVVVGLGSMGKRRIRLMQAFFEGIEIVGVDSNLERCEEAANQFKIKCFIKVGDAVAEFSPDAGFVCTSPLSHAAVTRSLLLFGLHVFSEINLVADGYDENIMVAKKKGLTLFLSSTPMYRKEIEYITGRVREGSGIHYRYHVGQYLPDWHPWESYKDFFVGDARTNGCRELLAIELPWMIAAFGPVTEVFVKKAKLTALEIDYPDCYTATLTHKNGTVGQLMVDVVSRKAVRDMEVVGERIYLRWGGTPETVSDYDIEKREVRMVECYIRAERDLRYADNIIEDAYIAEIADFLKTIHEQSTPRHSFETDRKILLLVDRFEESAEGDK